MGVEETIGAHWWTGAGVGLGPVCLLILSSTVYTPIRRDRLAIRILQA